MKKFFVKLLCLVENSLCVALTFIFLVSFCTITAPIVFISNMIKGYSLTDFVNAELEIWTSSAEAMSEYITEIEQMDKERFGI